MGPVPLRAFFLVFVVFAIIIIIASFVEGRQARNPIESVFKWKTVAYGPMDRSEKDLVGGHPYYIRGNIIPTAVAYHEKTAVMFIAAPRIAPGVIATLNSLDLFETFHLSSPIWTPYPNSQFNELQPWHFPQENDYEGGEESSEYEESDDCQSSWKKGPGFCKGYSKDDDLNIPDQPYLPEEFQHRSHSRYKRSYNETNIKIRISSSFPQSSDDSTEAGGDTAGPYSTGGGVEEDSLRIGLRNVRNLKTLISVNSLAVDACDRLWFIDTGVLDYGETGAAPLTVQRPSIWVVDVSTKDLFLIQRRFQFDRHTVPTPNGLRGFTVDVRGGNSNSCDSSFGVAYIANSMDSRIVVYDMQKEDAWYFEDKTMQPGPAYAGHLQFPQMDVDVSLGITDLTIGWRDSARERSIYYVPFTSEDVFVVSTRSLKRRLFDRTSEDAFKYIGRRGKRSQTESIAFDKDRGILFYAEVQTRSIKCWNVRKRLNRSNIGTVLESPNLEYPAHISIDNGGNLWVLSNNFPLFLQDRFNHDVYNIHLYRIVLKDVLKHSVCK